MSSVAATICLPVLFFKIYKRSLQHRGSLVLSKHVTHYGPRSDFGYYNLTVPPTLIERDPPIGHLRTHWAALWNWPMNLNQYPFCMIWDSQTIWATEFYKTKLIFTRLGIEARILKIIFFTPVWQYKKNWSQTIPFMHVRT